MKSSVCVVLEGISVPSVWKIDSVVAVCLQLQVPRMFQLFHTVHITLLGSFLQTKSGAWEKTKVSFLCLVFLLSVGGFF